MGNGERASGSSPTATSVRIARPEDAAAVERVLKASYPVLMAPAYDAGLLALALPLMTTPQPRLLGSGTFYVCEADGRAVGCGGWSFEKPGTSDAEPGIAHIRHFATDRDWTGRGIGRLVYSRCERQARAAGVRVFECYSSLNGEDFYAALGFVRIGPIEIPMGRRIKLPSIHMSRAI